jgi:hypothetical protein
MEADEIYRNKAAAIKATEIALRPIATVIFMPAFLSRAGAQPAFSSPIDATGRSVMGHHGNVTFNALVHIEHLEATGNIVELWQSASMVQRYSTRQNTF